MKTALTIAGSDSGGGAGIQADIKAMQANGVFAASILTAVTAQNTVAVTRAFELPLDVIEAQIDAVFDDIPVDATKTGMLATSAVIALVARKVKERGIRPLVVDPVMVSKSGFALLQSDAVATLKAELLPLATLVTPNIPEAELLADQEIRSIEAAHDAARRIHALGAGAVLINGGHLQDEKEATDILYDGRQFYTFNAPRIATPHTHGTGCTYASAITANLAKGHTLRGAIARAKRYVTDAIRHGFPLGSGHGPTDHFYFLRRSGIFPADDE